MCRLCGRVKDARFFGLISGDAKSRVSFLLLAQTTVCLGSRKLRMVPLACTVAGGTGTYLDGAKSSLGARFVSG